MVLFLRGPFTVFVVDQELSSGATVGCMKFSNDGKKILAVFEGRIYVLDAFDGAFPCADTWSVGLLTVPTRPTARRDAGRVLSQYMTGADDTTGPFEASFSPCSNYLLTGNQDRTIRIYNINKQEARRGPGPLPTARSMTLHSIALQEVACWHGHAGLPQCVQFAPRRMLVASACLGVALWIPDLRQMGGKL